LLFNAMRGPHDAPRAETKCTLPPAAMQGPRDAGRAEAKSTAVPPQDAALECYQSRVKEALDPMELAALARMRAWSRGDRPYTLQEMLELSRWVESRLRLTPRPRLWQFFDRSRRNWYASMSFIGTVMILVILLLALLTVAIRTSFQVLRPDSAGILVAASSTRQQVALGSPDGLWARLFMHRAFWIFHLCLQRS